MRTIVFVQQVPERYLEKIRQTIPDWRVVNLWDKEEWDPILSEAEIICGWRPEAAEACLRPSSRVKWVQAWGAGVDKMPLNALHRAGIAVTTASGVHPNPVSETAFAMMLAFSRKLHVSVRNQTRKLWQVSGDLGEIHNKTIGIVGVGAIGSEIARLAKAFGMRVLGVRLSGQPADHVDRMFDLGGAGNGAAGERFCRRVHAADRPNPAYVFPRTVWRNERNRLFHQCQQRRDRGHGSARRRIAQQGNRRGGA